MDSKYDDNWGCRMNRSKRKRLFRQEKSAERLHKRAARKQLLMRMGLAFPKEEIAHLMGIKKPRGFYRSTIADGDERLHFIMKSFKDYQKIGNLNEYDAAYFWMHVPTYFPGQKNHGWLFSKSLRIIWVCRFALESLRRRPSATR